MDKFTNDCNSCIKNCVNYKFINTLLKNNNYKHQIRNNKNGISLTDLLEYQSVYSLKNTKKQNISCNLNFNNNKKINRTSYYKKEKNIPFEFYEFLNTTISNLSYDFIKNINKNEKYILQLMEPIQMILNKMLF